MPPRKKGRKGKPLTEAQRRARHKKVSPGTPFPKKRKGRST